MKKLLLILFVFFLTLVLSEVYGGPGTFPQGDHIKQLKDKIEFKNNHVQIISNNTDNPTVVPQNAERGSLYIRSTDGKVYRKTDDGNSTNWNPLFDALDDIGLASATSTGLLIASDWIRFDGFEDLIITNAASISENLARILANEIDILTNTTSIGENLAKIIVNEGDILTNSASIAENLAKILASEIDILTNTASIAENLARIIVNENDIVTLTTSADNQDVTLTDHEGRITQNEADITTLDTASASYVLIDGSRDVTGDLDFLQSISVTDMVSAQSLSITNGATIGETLTVGATLTLETVTEVSSQTTFLSLVGNKVVKFVETFLADPTTTVGDLIYRNGSNVTARLPRGNDDQILKMNGTVPNWEDESGGGSGITWNVVTSNTTMTANNGYIANISDTATPLKFYLPTTMATGALFSISGLGNDGWELWTNPGAGTQSLKHEGLTTATSSANSIKLAESLFDWGHTDIIVSKNNQVVMSRNYTDVDFSAGILYYSGIAAHWKIDETSGSITDSASSFDLSRIGAVSSVTGKFENAASGFVSNTAHFKDYHPLMFDQGDGGSSKITVEAWVKFVGIGGEAQTIFANTNTDAYTGSANMILFQVQTTSTLTFGDNGNDTGVSVSSYSDDGEWHYIVGVADGTSSSGTKKWIYIDGVSVGDVDNISSTFQSANGWVIIGGTGSAGQHWQGSIDDVVFWDGVAMTQAQIVERYNSGNGRRYNQP